MLAHKYDHRNETDTQREDRRKRERQQPSFAAGVSAYSDGLAASDNPHPSGPTTGNDRYYWFQGYYGKRLWEKFAIPFVR